MNIWFFEKGTLAPSRKYPKKHEDSLTEDIDRGFFNVHGPVHDRDYGLGWRLSVRKILNPAIILCFYDNPPLLVQEIMAANWKEKNKQQRKDK